MYNWIQAGCPRDRLIVGVPGYGRAFAATGADPIKAYGQPAGASSIVSPYLGETGLLAYYEVRIPCQQFITIRRCRTMSIDRLDLQE
jgi:hypothetical protein